MRTDKNIIEEENVSERQVFPFYLSFEKGIQQLNDDDQLVVYRAISRYSLFGEEPKLEGFAAMAWSFIYPILQKSRKKFISGLKGADFGKLGGAPKGNQNARKQPQKQPQKQPTYTGTDTYTETNSYINNSNQRLERKNSSSVLPRLAQKDYVFVMDLWNDVCTRLRKITKLTSKNSGGKRSDRKGAIRYCLNFLAQNFTENKTLDEANALLRTAFEKANASNFLCGGSERGWKADFDWVMRDDHLIKILEGNYDNGKPKAATTANRDANDEWG